MSRRDVVVVGAGPAGLAAAIAAAQAGVQPLLIDEYETMGGQYFRSSAVRSPSRDKGRSREQQVAEALYTKLSDLGVEVKLGWRVWSSEGGELVADHDGTIERVPYRSLVLATGAYDRPVPFPGWTLPGVMTAGGAQAMAKAYSVLPGKRVVVAGAGPFLLPVASQLASVGADVVSYLEATGRREWLALGRAAIGQWARFREATTYMAALRRAGIRPQFRRKVIRAIGRKQLEGVVTAAVDRSWVAIPGTEQEVEVDALAVGYGFVPVTDLAALVGCQIVWDGQNGYWKVVRDASTMETSVPGVFAAGELGGIAGADAAVIQGTIAGSSAAARARGGSPQDLLRSATGSHRRKLRGNMRFAQALNRLTAPRPGLWEGLADPTTVVCRCEEVTTGDLRSALAEGCSSHKAMKDRTRCGMGLCQGRICGTVVSRILADMTGQDQEEFSPPTVRPPLRPVPLANLVINHGAHK